MSPISKPFLQIVKKRSVEEIGEKVEGQLRQCLDNILILPPSDCRRRAKYDPDLDVPKSDVPEEQAERFADISVASDSFVYRTQRGAKTLPDRVVFVTIRIRVQRLYRNEYALLLQPVENRTNKILRIGTVLKCVAREYGIVLEAFEA